MIAGGVALFLILVIAATCRPGPQPDRYVTSERAS